MLVITASLTAALAIDAGNFDAEVALDPRSSTARSGLGLLYLKTGQKDKASAELTKALQLDPNNADARAALKK